MKKLLILLVLVVVAVPVGVAVFGGQLLGKGVEKGGTLALGTETTVGGASLNLLSGSVGLDELAIRNPEGFQSKHAFQVDSIGVQTDVGSLMSDKIRIDEIRIASPAITLEVNTSGTNLGHLMDNLEKLSGGGGSAPEESSGGGKKMSIGRLVIETPKVSVVQSLLSKNEAKLTLPTLTMEEVGNDLTMAELMEKILGLVMAAVSEAQIDGQLKGLLKGKIPGDLKKQLDGAVSDVLKPLQDLGGDLGETLGGDVGGAAKEALDGLGGLLGGDKDKKDKKDK